MSFLKNDKNVKLLSICICIIWCISFFASFFSMNLKQKNYEKLYAELTASSHYYNTVLKWENENSNSNTQETPLFNNAKEAVVTAWSNFQNSSSFEIFGDGGGVGSAKVGAISASVNMYMQNNICKWEDGTMFYEIQRYQVDPLPLIGNPLTRSDEYYLPVGERWHRKSLDLTYENEKITSNYTAEFKKNEEKNTFSYFDYNISTNTIVYESFFKVNRNIYTNKIESYSCSVVLNNATAAVNFLNNIKDENKDVIVGEPVMTKLNINCLIDPTGNFIILRAEECYQFTANYYGFIADVATDSSINYNFISINKTPEREKLW